MVRMYASTSYPQDSSPTYYNLKDLQLVYNFSKFDIHSYTLYYPSRQSQYFAIR